MGDASSGSSRRRRSTAGRTGALRSAPTLSVAARHFAKDDIGRARYTWQMPRREQVFLNLDWKQMGVGGIDSWSPNAWPLAPYRLDGSQARSFKYRLSPID